MSARGSETKWPVPLFNQSYDKPGQRKIGEELRSAYKALHSHICNKPTPVSESWKSRYRTLLMQLIAAQHKTVWADSGNETQQDTARLHGFFNSKEKIAELVRNSVRNNPGGASEVSEYLAASQSRFDELIKAADVGFGRRAFLVTALRAWLAELDRDMSSTIVPRYRIRLSDYQALRNAAARSLEATHQEIYRSAIASVTRRVPASAQTFDIFYPAEHDPNFPLTDDNGRLLSDTIAKGISALTGKTFDLKAYYAMTGEYYQGYSSTPFSEGTAKRVLGECEGRRVSLYYHPSRKDDAARAGDILRQNGFQTESYEMGQANSYKGHIYVHRNGSRDGANRIAALIRSIETVSPVEEPGRSGDYELFIGSKDEEINVDELSWETSFHYYGHFADPKKKRHRGRCPATTPPGSHRGAEGGPYYYSPASGICIAGVHAGLITFKDGGVLTWEFDESRAVRTTIGSMRFGVTSGTLENFPIHWYFIR